MSRTPSSPAVEEINAERQARSNSATLANNLRRLRIIKIGKLPTEEMAKDENLDLLMSFPNTVEAAIKYGQQTKWKGWEIRKILISSRLVPTGLFRKKKVSKVYVERAVLNMGFAAGIGITDLAEIVRIDANPAKPPRDIEFIEDLPLKFHEMRYGIEALRDYLEQPI